MRDQRNKTIYYLFFASNHPLGHAKIKEVFWKVDTERGFRFSDRTNPDQLVLFEIDPSIDLGKVLKRLFSGTTELSETVIGYVENETAYTSSHAKKALIELEKNSEIAVDPNKLDGKKRIKSTFPNGVKITFK